MKQLSCQWILKSKYNALNSLVTMQNYEIYATNIAPGIGIACQPVHSFHMGIF